jgi:adenylate kinase family enzyme
VVRVQRVAVIGNSGSGKSTLAKALSARLGLPHVELDSIYHQAGWTQLPTDEYRARVGALVQAERWVVDGNYAVLRDLVWGRADTLIWLDLPRPVVTWRIVRRSLHRVARGAELWNGNRERLRSLLSLDPENSVIAWSVRQHAEYRRMYSEVPADPQWAHLVFVRLRSPAAVRDLLTATNPP